MGPIPFAFSVHNFVNSVGAYAGFAAIVGLAILVLLYFAQARETATLREHAYEAAQRIQQLEARIAQLSRRGAEPARQPTVAPAPAAITASRGMPAAAPAVAATAAATAVAIRRTASPAPALAGAPAGVGAPALNAATRLIPVVGPEHGELEPGTGSATAVAPPPATAAAAAAAAGAVAASANGRSHDDEQPVPVGAGPVQAPPRRPSGPSGNGAAQRPLLPPRNEPPRGPSTVRKVLAVVVALLVIAAVVVALLLLTATSGSTTSTSSNANTSSSAPKTHKKATVRVATINPATVTVSVLNGTATAGLAHRVSVELTGVGFKQGAVATAADQTRTATIVAYQPGHRPAALGVAKSLKLGPAVVQPVDQSTLAVACPPPTPCTSTVFVTVGSDLQNTP